MAARIKQTVGKLFKKQSTPPSSADPPRSPRAKAVDERSEFEESVYFESDRDGCVSGHGGDVESSDLDQEGQSKQPTNIKKKKKRLGRSKSDSHERAKRIVPSESSGPDTEKECFRKRSKSANAKLGCMTAAAIKPFQKYVGSSGAENRLESDTTDHEPKVSPAIESSIESIESTTF